MNLKIYDASWLIHYGSSSRRYQEFSYAGFGLGGLKFLVNNVMHDLYCGYHVVVCFDSKTDKSVQLEGYKSHRPFQAHILSQMNFAFNMLKKANVCCLKEPNREADDLIYSVVELAKSDYDQIIIVSNDKDLAHNVDNTVFLEACSPGGIDISVRNFTQSITNKTEVAFNTVSAYKVFTGDASDNIRSFKSESGIWGKEFYRQYVDILEELELINSVHARDRALFGTFIDSMTSFTEMDKDIIRRRANIIYPTFVQVDFTPTRSTDVKNVDTAKLLTLLSETVLLEKLQLQAAKLSADEFNNFKQSASSLKDHSFAVEQDCPLNVDFSADYEITNMRSF